MIVKGHQPQRHQDIHRVFHEAHALAPPLAAAETVDSGHGRIEHRRLTASAARLGYRDGPGRGQVFHLERGVTLKKGGKPRHEVVYGVTSLGPDRATPARLLPIVRPPWQIENQVPGVRDVTFDEDRSQVRCGSLPQVMAAFRHTAMGLMRRAGEVHLAAACRRFAAQPWAALALIGIIPEN